MADRPPFDPIAAGFWLIAGVLAVQCVVALVSLGTCVYWSGAVVEGKANCENINATIGQLLTGALAAALAFVAGKRDK
jgi:hypothetical protein